MREIAKEGGNCEQFDDLCVNPQRVPFSPKNTLF
jgi:hypothetical protein